MTQENTEMNNNVEMAQEVVKMAKIDMRTAAEIGIGAVITGGIAYGVKKLVWDKFIAPKIQDRKAKKLDKKLKAAAEVE